jgi:hypothetical protein
MTRLALACALALLATGCTQPPPANLYAGDFEGPVVARRNVPDTANYRNLCAQPAQRWQYGSYRAYSPCPNDEGWTNTSVPRQVY